VGDIALFSDNLSKERTQRRLSQKQLADLCHVSLNTVKNWESGGSEPSISNLLELSKILGVTTDYLLGRGTSRLINLDYLSEKEYELINLIIQFLITHKGRDD